MGFKCPICNKDFNSDKDLFEKHCGESHLGVAQDIKKVIDLTIPVKEVFSIQEKEHSK